MNLSGGFQETIRAVLQIREWTKIVARAAFHIDFKGIRRITPAAALLLAAELDRWNRTHSNQKLRAADVHLWDPEVRQLLKEMGLFELLHIDDSRWFEDKQELNEAGVTFMPFYVGEGSGGMIAEQLRDKIEAIAGPLRDRYGLYDGLVEAMTNVSHHAYPGSKMLRRWWISASVDRTLNKLTVLCLDHGVGIPKTLPRKNLESFRLVLDRVGSGVLKDDARMIKAAMSLERTATGRRNRGYGLQRDIKRYAARNRSAARLRIFSNSGMYRYEKSAGGDNETLVRLPRSIRGTFIEWVIDNYGTSNANH
jgi:hypothetical protein